MGEATGFFFVRLPPQLSEAEMAALLARPLDEASRRLLAETNVHLVIFIAEQFPNIERDIAIEIGIEGLIKAAEHFDPAKQVKFASYAGVCIKNQLLMHLRKIKPQRLETSIESSIHVDKEGNELSFEDILADKDPRTTPGDLTDALMDLRHAVSRLSPKDQQLLQMRFVEDLTQKAIAFHLGLSQSYISRRLGQILSLLKNMMSR